ncbi:MAG: NUDIX hydrolase [Defluviitaleaceae bacterium]|nr:NUDIX hydrolase [Defluviitaleaceae bacterium]
MEYKIVNREEIYKGRIVNVFLDDVELPSGAVAKREIVLHHREGVGILPVDNDGGIFLVRQYRHPLLQHVLEIPAGISEQGEDPAACAARELEEEIGYKANKLTFLVSANNTVGVSDDRIHIYVAENLVKTAQNLDEDEFLEIEKYSLADCEKMIANGEIIDSKTILAIYGYKLMARE